MPKQKAKMSNNTIKYLRTGRLDLLVKEFFSVTPQSVVCNMDTDEVFDAMSLPASLEGVEGTDWLTENIYGSCLGEVIDNVLYSYAPMGRFPKWTDKKDQVWMEKKNEFQDGSVSVEHSLVRGIVSVEFEEESYSDEHDAHTIYYLSVSIDSGEVAASRTGLEPGGNIDDLKLLAEWVMDRVYVLSLVELYDGGFEGSGLFGYAFGDPLTGFYEADCARNDQRLVWNFD